MTESNQASAAPWPVSTEKKPKIYYEHGKDALELALSVAQMQEEKALRKAEKHRRPRVTSSGLISQKAVSLPPGDSDCGGDQNDRGHRAGNRRERLAEAKVMIAKRRAEAKKEKARSKKASKSRLRLRDGVESTAQGESSTAPRKRVSFA